MCCAKFLLFPLGGHKFRSVTWWNDQKSSQKTSLYQEIIINRNIKDIILIHTFSNIWCRKKEIEIELDAQLQPS